MTIACAFCKRELDANIDDAVEAGWTPLESPETGDPTGLLTAELVAGKLGGPAALICPGCRHARAALDSRAG